MLVLQQILEREIRKVTHWLAANKLILNLTKTHCMLFTFQRKQQKLEIKINDTSIEEKTVTSFLGVQLDNKLNWKAHIAHICNKVSKAIAILRFVRYSYPKNILKMIYMSLIYSHINYCNLIWGAAEVGIIEPLFILQKKSIRIITKSPYLEHTAPYLIVLNCLQYIRCIHLIALYLCTNVLNIIIVQSLIQWFTEILTIMITTPDIETCLGSLKELDLEFAIGLFLTLVLVFGIP